MTDNSIILIGPMGIGKTSVSKILANELGLEYIDIDELRWVYFSQQDDFDGELVDKLFGDSKEAEAFTYVKPFEARYVVDMLKKYQSGIFDFGAGYTVYDNEELFTIVKSALASYKYVIFLRYSKDNSESLEALRSRHEDIPDDLYLLLNKAFIESPCNEQLATSIIDTKGKTVSEVADEILEIVRIR